jgi:hypothetical protein
LEDALAVSKGRGQWCVDLSPVAPSEEDGMRFRVADAVGVVCARVP